MPTISKIRLCNIIYEGGKKRYNDETFIPDGNNTAFILENGGGKTVLVQMILQSVLPTVKHADRNIRETLSLDTDAAHIAVEWILNEHPRRYLVTGVTLFTKNKELKNHLYTYEYEAEDKNGIEYLPFTQKNRENIRPSSQQEVNDYYLEMKNKSVHAKMFNTLKSYHENLEKEYHISHSEWMSISKINALEGGIEMFFDNCRTTSHLVNNLIIPTVEDAFDSEQSKVFIKTFETHQEHLRAYKQLKGDIEQNENIKRHVDDYVKFFSNYHEANVLWLNEKSKMKGIAEYVETELKKLNLSKIKINDQIDLLNKSAYELKRDMSSLEIADKEVEVDEAYKYHQIANTYLEDKKGEKAILDIQLEILELSKMKNELDGYLAELESLKIELILTEEELNLKELANQLVQTKSELFYIFKEKVNKEQSKINDLNDKISDVNNHIKNQNTIIDQNGMKINTQDLALNKARNFLELKNKNLEKLKSLLIGLEDQMSVKVYYDIKQKRVRALSEELTKVADELLQKKESIKAIEESLININEEINMSMLSKQSADTELKTILGEIELLSSSYISVLNKPLIPHKVYEQEMSIKSDLQDRLFKLKKDKENQLTQEAMVLYDHQLYKDQMHFTADPNFMNKIESWSGQFSVLHSGINFLENHYKEEKDEMIELYPYWSITVVTTENEKQKLVTKIEAYDDNLTHPVYVLSLEEAKKARFDQDIVSVFPRKWSAHASDETFDLWKKDIKDTLEVVKNSRQSAEENLLKLEQLSYSLHLFFEKFPNEHNEKCKVQLRYYEDMAIKQKLEKRQATDSASSLKEACILMELRIESIKDETRHLVEIINKSHEYLNVNQDVKKLEIEAYDCENELKYLKEEFNKYQRDLERFEYVKANSEKDKEKIENEIKSVQENTYYQRVSDCDTSQTVLSLPVLCSEMDRLQHLLYEGSEDREIIEKRIEVLKKTIIDTKEQIGSTIIRIDSVIDLDSLAFPVSGIKQINQYKNDIKDINAELNDLNNAERASKTTLDKLEGEISSLRGAHVSYGVITIFDKNLSLVRDELEQIDRTLKEQDRLQINALAKLEKALLVIESCNKEIIRVQDKFELDDVSVYITDTSESFRIEFNYNPSETLNKFIKGAEAVYQNKKIQADELSNQRELFKSFCSEYIVNPKMKKLTLDALKYREDYKAVLEWQKKLDININSALKYLNESLRTRDEAINKFIDRLYIYLDSVAKEIDRIANKTSVDIDGIPKKIFSIRSPIYEEHQAKIAVREHLIMMTDHLNKEEFAMASKEEIEVVKKKIKEWLSTKTLLHIIFKGKEIKVSCRKVTNDFKISSSFIDWTSSNKWSGGEKWSKNMTLFLGIQNYIAERKHVAGGRGKRQRTVLLDNPFGKASSDHVLGPVFKIASQLGFQLIAFTAHVEGKFISDYFPIVYSCRLRDSVRQGVQVMSNTKNINYAFLQDQNPMSILRLNNLEQEQLRLFD